jgi:hypothetical protein
MKMQKMLTPKGVDGVERVKVKFNPDYIKYVLNPKLEVSVPFFSILPTSPQIYNRYISRFSKKLLGMVF